MDRRNLLKALFGVATVAVATPLFLGNEAEAMPLANPMSGQPNEPAAAPAVATEEDLDPAKIEKAQYWYHRRHYYWRRRHWWHWHRRRWHWRRRRWWWRHRHYW